jgi:hypothetical protein
MMMMMMLTMTTTSFRVTQQPRVDAASWSDPFRWIHLDSRFLTTPAP